jgi:hypothetical protein
LSSRQSTATPSPEDAPPSEEERPQQPLRTTIETARKVLESLIIAVVTSTGLYLVGSVYTEAYYGRMSIEAGALDLTPPYIALQSVHVVQSLLIYPVALLWLYLLFRLFRWATTRLPRLRSGIDSLRRRLGRLGLLVVNGVIIAPLILAAFNAAVDPALAQTNSPLSEVASLMQFCGAALVVYVVWLSLGPRHLLFTEIKRRQLLPIALLFTLYLLDALVATAEDATIDAELMLTGVSDSSVAVNFTLASGVQALPDTELLLITIRNGHYFVVEKQPDPPSLTPSAYAIPVRAVDAVHMVRVNPASPITGDFEITLFASPTAP